MARTPAAFTGGHRLSDYLRVDLLVKFYPRENVRAVLAASGRQHQRQDWWPPDLGSGSKAPALDLG